MATVDTPHRTAPRLPKLSARAELAVLARSLARSGFGGGIGGHLSYLQPDGTLLVNPFGLTWEELTAADVMQMTVTGDVLDGPWTVPSAIQLHLALHAA